MKLADFLAVKWTAPGPALIEPPRLSPIIADPSFLFPEESPSGDWELFAHSAWGVHRHSSTDALSWNDRGLVVRNAMRPFARMLPRERGPAECALLFEAYPPLALPLTALPLKRKWRSWIALSRSQDLGRWSRPSVLLEADRPWTMDPALGSAVSNPCLVEAGAGNWRLYHSASLAWIDDCGFTEPRYIGLATASSPEGPFSSGENPLLDPANDPAPGALGAGSMKVLAFEDGYIALQNKIYRDSGGRSRSAIFLLRSEDGLLWRSARSEPLVAPAAGWTSSHVYACDCRFRESEGLWYLYFNARDGWRMSEGMERIGRLVGAPV